MQDEYSSSMISSAKTNINVPAMETSDSTNTNIYAIHARNNKRPRLEYHHEIDTNNIIASSSAKFKGVVPQQNGHWGAQIYANHQRIWLGTFKSEKAAAMAYDSAAIKLRSGDSQRNFPWTSLTIQEPDFQSRHTTKMILNMIKDNSYQSKFEEFVRTRSQSKEDFIEKGNHDQHLNKKIKGHGDAQFLTRQLFQKELTPSDVGKLNRLVIPKKFAVKYFPYINEDINHVEGNGVVEDIELVFYDKNMRPWRFRYCYWKSSQSFVFTRGWNRFVKENSLKANDVITFHACEHYFRSTGILREVNGGQSFCLIDVTHNGVNVENKKCLSNNKEEASNYYHCEKHIMKVAWKQNFYQGNDQFKYNEEDVSNNLEKKGIRLFGVHIK